MKPAQIAEKKSTPTRIDALTVVGGLTKPFQWRDRNGDFHDVAKMETRHLFYTVRMIWNHTVPDFLKLRPYIEYTFNPFYTPEYMYNAVEAILNELASRDLPPEYEGILKWMSKAARRHIVMRIE